MIKKGTKNPLTMVTKIKDQDVKKEVVKENEKAFRDIFKATFDGLNRVRGALGEKLVRPEYGSVIGGNMVANKKAPNFTTGVAIGNLLAAVMSVVTHVLCAEFDEEGKMINGVCQVKGGALVMTDQVVESMKILSRSFGLSSKEIRKEIELACGVELTDCGKFIPRKRDAVTKCKK